MGEMDVLATAGLQVSPNVREHGCGGIVGEKSEWLS